MLSMQVLLIRHLLFHFRRLGAVVQASIVVTLGMLMLLFWPLLSIFRMLELLFSSLVIICQDTEAGVQDSVIICQDGGAAVKVSG